MIELFVMRASGKDFVRMIKIRFFVMGVLFFVGLSGLGRAQVFDPFGAANATMHSMVEAAKKKEWASVYAMMHSSYRNSITYDNWVGLIKPDWELIDLIVVSVEEHEAVSIVLVKIRERQVGGITVSYKALFLKKETMGFSFYNFPFLRAGAPEFIKIPSAFLTGLN